LRDSPPDCIRSRMLRKQRFCSTFFVQHGRSNFCVGLLSNFSTVISKAFRKNYRKTTAIEFRTFVSIISKIITRETRIHLYWLFILLSTLWYFVHRSWSMSECLGRSFFFPIRFHRNEITSIINNINVFRTNKYLMYMNHSILILANQLILYTVHTCAFIYSISHTRIYIYLFISIEQIVLITWRFCKWKYI